MNAEGTPSKPPSRSTLYQALKRHGLTNYKAKKRSKFTRAHALLRLKFAHEYRHCPWVRRTLKFSDECSVQKASGANQEWCFRYPWEKWKPEMLDPTSTILKPAQMVWACVWLDERGCARRSKLVIMERDPDAKKRGYSAQSYMEALTKGLFPHWRRYELFMQDNAGIHRSRAVVVSIMSTTSTASNGQHTHPISTQLNTFGGCLSDACISSTHNTTTLAKHKRNGMGFVRH